MYRRTLQIREKTLGNEDMTTLENVEQLALAIGSQGRQAEAADAHLRVSRGYGKILGRDHPATKCAARNVAIALGS